MFGRNERAFNSSVVCVVTALESWNSIGKTLFFRTFLYFLGRISSIQCDNRVTFELWAGSSTCLYIFNRHSTTMNPMEEKERRPIPTLQTSRDGHSNSLSISLNTTWISPSAGPTGSCPQNVLNSI